MPLGRRELRELDRLATEEFGVPGAILMENAGRASAEVLEALGAKGPVAICCGKGNNGGDGMVIARHLDLHSIPVTICLFARAEELHGDAELNYRICQRTQLAIQLFDGFDRRLPAIFSGAEWVVDALYGTGLSGPIRAPLDRVVECMNNCGRPIVAVDIPSGLDCDTGLPLGPTIRASHTVTLVTAKLGFQNPAATAYLGRVHVAEIGAPRVLLERFGVFG